MAGPFSDVASVAAPCSACWPNPCEDIFGWHAGDDIGYLMRRIRNDDVARGRPQQVSTWTQPAAWMGKKVEWAVTEDGEGECQQRVTSYDEDKVSEGWESEGWGGMKNILEERKERCLEYQVRFEMDKEFKCSKQSC